ncbi:Poly [ADP-ribose] polymerase 14 [Merluccius polli]|uniref:Poly [ADP-ribose] polymerase 14 n=1 Tax=Merluccius polli TaxID=89951 RepID=A0AA47MKC7_MERPO|nr:Poly [ADP-ribose] polymerase 14 [Merluccius polli]
MICSEPYSVQQLTTTSSNKQIHSGGRPAEEEIQVEAASREEPTEEPALCSTSAVLENVPQDMSKDFMEMLVENICTHFQSPMNTQPEFSLEILSDLCSAVVTFSSGKENNEFITSCQTNRMFLSKNLSVRPLEVTAKVKVDDVSNIKLDVLQMYLENNGWEVEQVTKDEEEQSAIICFKMDTDVQGIIKKKHLIRETPVKFFPFYNSLGTALYGKDRPTLKLPAAFSESIDPTILTYLHKKQEAAQMVCSAFAALFCKVDLLSSSVSFSPLPTLLQQKGVKAKDIKEWKHSVQQAFAQVLSRFKTLRLQPPLSAWEEFEARIREVVVNKAVEVIPDKAEGALSVIGFVDDVTRLEPTINELSNRIEKKVVRENTSIIQGFEIPQEHFQLLCEDGLPDLLKIQYPQLEITYEDKLILKGLSHEISDAASLIMTGVQKILDGHAEPALCSTSAVLENIPQDMSKDFLEMLVENICTHFQSLMSTQHQFSLEILSDLCSAVVTFSSGKENNEFITCCKTNRMFLSKNLSVRPLEITAKVIVEDVSNIKQEDLLQYFGKKGWEVERITPNQREQSAIISFKMDTGILWAEDGYFKVVIVDVVR